MSKEKMIEEMASSLNEATFGVNVQTLADHLYPETINRVAEYLYNVGYRKQSEGEWLTKGGFFMEHVCSVCGYSVDYLYQRTPFCPECGARMKGGK
jgi:rubrerythrin